MSLLISALETLFARAELAGGRIEKIILSPTLFQAIILEASTIEGSILFMREGTLYLHGIPIESS